jgi:hypothetical protein
LLIGDDEYSEAPEWVGSWWKMGQESSVCWAAETRNSGIKNTAKKTNAANDLFLNLIAVALQL